MNKKERIKREKRIRKRAKLQNTKEHKKRIKHVKRAYRKGLILTYPNCGHICPKGKKWFCGCEGCMGIIIFKEEFNDFSEKEQEVVRSLINKEGHFYTKGKGCALPPKFRPTSCLEYCCEG